MECSRMVEGESSLEDKGPGLKTPGNSAMMALHLQQKQPAQYVEYVQAVIKTLVAFRIALEVFEMLRGLVI